MGPHHASERSGRPLFLGSYPITPATDILHELAKRKDLGVTAVQMEDEIAGVCSAIGASFAGDLAVTSTSGPGLALKGEGIGLAVIAELPLVIIDVMRGGPSTGMPTKTEQTDLMQALYGRNGESPLCVLAATTPTNCFDMAFEAARIAIEHMTPVILLTDAFIGNGSSAWRVPEADEYPEIHPRFVPESLREAGSPISATKNRWYATGRCPAPSSCTAWAALKRTARQEPYPPTQPTTKRWWHCAARKWPASPTTYPGRKCSATRMPTRCCSAGAAHTDTFAPPPASSTPPVYPMAFTQLAYINPLPRNMGEIMSRYKRVIVAELNSGMCAEYLQARFPATHIDRINKVQGQPFQVSEIVDKVREILGK